MRKVKIGDTYIVTEDFSGKAFPDNSEDAWNFSKNSKITVLRVDEEGDYETSGEGSGDATLGLYFSPSILEEYVDAGLFTLVAEDTEETQKEIYTGGSSSYYKIFIANPTSEDVEPYMAECNDIIEALEMDYAEGNEFKSIWRRCAARVLDVRKKGYDDGLYDAEKGEFFAVRNAVKARLKRALAEMEKGD